jgi:hypothetical protein
MSPTSSNTSTSSVFPTDSFPTSTLLMPPAVANQPIWSTPVILAALLALAAIFIGIPGAILASKKLRKPKAGGSNGKFTRPFSNRLLGLIHEPEQGV